MAHPIVESAPPARSSAASFRAFLDAGLLPLSFVGVLIVWEAAVRLLDVPIFLVPAPSRIAYSLYTMLKSGLLVWHFGITFFEAVGGFAISFTVAAVFAIVITESRLAERLVYPYFTAVQAMPKVAIAPLIVIWFGYGYSSKVVLAALLSLFPMLVNFVAGLKSADEGRLKMMRAMDASRWQVLRYVKIPYAMPFFFAGVELGGLYAMLGAIVAEFVGASAGVGNWLIAMNVNLDTASTFALLLVLAAYGMAFQRLVATLRRRVLFWAYREQEQAGAAPSS
jgi:NitT/TauT family transport system permease protein